MPVARRTNGKRDDSPPDLKRLTLVNSDFGACYLEMGELTIAPGKGYQPRQGARACHHFPHHQVKREFL